MSKDLTTEEKIKQAAKKIFQQKGYGLTRTRDIAEEADINLALLNYYFRGKKKLYDIIMHESLHDMFSFLSQVINDPNTSLSYKIDKAVSKYMNLLEENPNLPLFVLNEIQIEGSDIFLKAGIKQGMLKESFFIRQVQEQIERKKLTIKPQHLFINMVSLSVFPLMAKSMVETAYNMNEDEYKVFIEERRLWVPLWLKAMLQLED